MDYTISQIKNKLLELAQPLPYKIAYIDLFSDVSVTQEDTGSTVILYALGSKKILEVADLETFMELTEDDIWEALRLL